MMVSVDIPAQPPTKLTVKQRGLALRDKLKAHPIRNAVIGGVCVLMLAAGITVIPQWFIKEIRLVDDYLAALQEGDAQSAIAIADGGETHRSYSCNDGTHCHTDDAFLTDEALNTDWEYDSLSLGHETGNSEESVTRVYATIIHDEREVVSEFKVSQAHGQTWLVQPYALVNMAAFQVEPVSMDGVTVPIGAAPNVNTDSFPASIDYLVFPGPHRMMAGSKMYRLPADETDVLWASENVDYHMARLPDVELRNEAQEAAEQGFKNYLDECATDSTIAPPGCPFGADEGPYVETSSDLYENVENVEWEITTYPELKFVPEKMLLNERKSVSSLWPSTVKPGYVVISADSSDGSFEAECQIETGAVTVSVTGPMKFEFSSREVGYSVCAEYD